jgi:hypothetical protein
MCVQTLICRASLVGVLGVPRLASPRIALASLTIAVLSQGMGV